MNGMEIEMVDGGRRLGKRARPESQSQKWRVNPRAVVGGWELAAGSYLDRWEPRGS